MTRLAEGGQTPPVVGDAPMGPGSADTSRERRQQMGPSVARSRSVARVQKAATARRTLVEARKVRAGRHFVLRRTPSSGPATRDF